MAHVNLQSDMITLNASYSTRCSRSEEPSICMDKSSILGNGSTAKSEAFTENASYTPNIKKQEIPSYLDIQSNHMDAFEHWSRGTTPCWGIHLKIVTRKHLIHRCDRSLVSEISKSPRISCFRLYDLYVNMISLFWRCSILPFVPSNYYFET